MKRPSFQFYPGDWRRDPGVQALDFHDRGVWFEILCLMHESDERGVLLLNGAPMPESALARVLGLDNQILNQTLTTLLGYGVASRRDGDGALICRRMIRDEELSQIRKEAGKKGGNPNLVKQNGTKASTTQDKQKPTPSSSSSSSSSASATPSLRSGDWHAQSASDPTSAPSNVARIARSSDPPETEPEKPKPKPKRATGIPDHFEVDLEMQTWFRDQGVPGDVAEVTEHFLDHHRAKGSTFKDWQAAWRTWCRNQIKFGGQHGQARQGHPGEPRIGSAERTRIAIAEQRKREGRA